MDESGSDGASALQPGESADQLVALFVDSQNLFHAARDSAGRNVDYTELLRLALRGRRLQAASAYVVEREGDSASYGFVTRLSALGYRVKRRALRVHYRDDSGRAVLEGDWDMGIAADIVRACDHCDVIALASGDGDFGPMLELAQERGLRVEVLAFRDATAQSLVDLADRYIDLASAPGALLTGGSGGK